MESAYEQIIDRTKFPVNEGTIANPQIKCSDSNPLCGDELEIFAEIENNEIQEMKFQSKGCAISKASVDILSEYVIGKNIDEVQGITNDEMLGQLGINVSPMRLKCALLGLVALKKGIKEFKNDTKN